MPNHALDYDLDSVLPFAQVEQEKKVKLMRELAEKTQ